MIKEEKQLNIDLESFEKKMQSWTTSVATLSSHTKAKQQNDNKTLSVPPEVTAFQVLHFREICFLSFYIFSVLCLKLSDYSCCISS